MTHLHEDEQEWQRLADAATAGPWNLYDPTDSVTDRDGHIIAQTTPVFLGWEQATRNRRFIATARTVVPELLVRLEIERAEVLRLKHAIAERRHERRLADKERRTAYHEWQEARIRFKREAVHDHVRRVCKERDALKALLPEHVWKQALGIVPEATGRSETGSPPAAVQ